VTFLFISRILQKNFKALHWANRRYIVSTKLIEKFNKEEDLTGTLRFAP